MKRTGNNVASLLDDDIAVLNTFDGATLDWLGSYHALPLQVERAPNNTSGMDEPTNWAKAAAQRVSALAWLPENWDGCGGLPPRVDVLETVWLLLERLQDTVIDLETPAVLSVPDGSVQLEWTYGCKHVEFRALSSDSILCLRNEERGSKIAIEVDDLTLDAHGISTIRQQLRWLIAE